jgi:hypothetical protein
MTFVVSINLNDGQLSRFQFHQNTTVLELINYICSVNEKLGGEGKLVDYCGVFLPKESIRSGEESDDGIWLKEKRTLVSYGLIDHCKCSPSFSLESCTCSCKSVYWKQRPVLVDSSVFIDLLSISDGLPTPSNLLEATDFYLKRLVVFFKQAARGIDY